MLVTPNLSSVYSCSIEKDVLFKHVDSTLCTVCTSQGNHINIFSLPCKLLAKKEGTWFLAVHACVFKHRSCIWKFNAHENIIIRSYVLWIVFLLMWYHNLYHCSVAVLEMFLWWHNRYLKFIFTFYWSWCLMKYSWKREVLWCCFIMKHCGK